MNYGQFTRFRQYKFNLKLINFMSDVLIKVKNSKTLEKVKQKIPERWRTYWTHVFMDYKEVAVNVVQDCKARPIRASTYASFAALCVYMNKHNPDECAFRSQLLQNTMKLMQVGELIRNPTSEHHVKWLEQCYNEGIIRRLNFGIISVIWLDNYDKECSLYKAICSYLKPQYITFYQRVVDVGCLDKWWFLEAKMKDYDINDTEFSNVKYE